MASYTNVLLTSENALTPAITGTDARDKAINLSTAIKAMASGVKNGSMIVQLDGAKATGTLTIDYSKIAADDNVKIGATTFTCKASGANGTTEFNKVTNATATAASLVTAINANTTTSTYLVATSALGVVTLLCKQPGLIGNAIGLIVTENTGSSIVPSAANLASGTNGTVSTLSFGL
jgi:phage tail sheath gpL-like